MASDHLASENKEDLKNRDLPPPGWKHNLALLMIKEADELRGRHGDGAAGQVPEASVHAGGAGTLCRLVWRPALPHAVLLHPPGSAHFLRRQFSRAAHERGPGHRSQGVHTPTPVPSEHQAEGAPVYQKFLIKVVLVPSGCRVDSRRLSFQRAFPRVVRLQGADWN